MAYSDRSYHDERRRILTAAVDVFSLRGFAEASQREIARKAGVAPALVHHLFPTRAALIGAAAQAALMPAGLEGVLAPMRHEAPRDALARIARLVMGLPGEKRRRQFLHKVMQEAHQDPEMVQAVWEALLRPVVAALAAYLVERSPAAGVRVEDPAIFAHAFVASLLAFSLGPLLWPQWPAGDFDAERVVSGVVDAFYRGLTPSS